MNVNTYYVLLSFYFCWNCLLRAEKTQKKVIYHLLVFKPLLYRRSPWSTGKNKIKIMYTGLSVFSRPCNISKLACSKPCTCVVTIAVERWRLNSDDVSTVTLHKYSVYKAVMDAGHYTRKWLRNKSLRITLKYRCSCASQYTVPCNNECYSYMMVTTDDRYP